MRLFRFRMLDMKTTVRDFTDGDIKKQILAFFFPMLITNLLQQIYNFVDTMIVGKGLGDNSLAAVGNMGSLFFLIVGFSLGLSNGFGILIAQSYGAKNFPLLRKNLAAIIHLSVVITVVLTTFSILFLPAALRLLKTDPVIMADSLKYGYIVFGGLFASILYNVSSCVLRSLGDSRTPLYAIITSSVINIALDLMFIFVLKTGVEGAAYATVLSQVISSLICIRKLRRIDIIRLKREDYRVKGIFYLRLLLNGIPMALMNSVTAVGCMVVQAFVNEFGVEYTSAYSVCSRYLNLFMNPACTAGTVISAFSGQNFGAGQYKRIRQGLQICISIAILSYLIFGSVLVFGNHYLASFMLKGELARSLAETYLPITGIALIMVDGLFVYRSAVQGMGYPLIPMLSGIAEMFLRIGIILFLTGGIGFAATAFAEVGAWSGAFMINMIAFYAIYYAKTKTSPHMVRHVAKGAVSKTL